MSRTFKESAKWYRTVIAENGENGEKSGSL
jgi:beta-glucosidase/6-phospho-beta-glucosidase/beta-galactosidase